MYSGRNIQDILLQTTCPDHVMNEEVPRRVNKYQIQDMPGKPSKDLYWMENEKATINLAKRIEEGLPLLNFG